MNWALKKRGHYISVLRDGGVATCAKSNYSIENASSQSDCFMKVITMGLQRMNKKKSLAARKVLQLDLT